MSSHSKVVQTVLLTKILTVHPETLTPRDMRVGTASTYHPPVCYSTLYLDIKGIVDLQLHPRVSSIDRVLKHLFASQSGTSCLHCAIKKKL